MGNEQMKSKSKWIRYRFCFLIPILVIRWTYLLGGRMRIAMSSTDQYWGPIAQRCPVCYDTQILQYGQRFMYCIDVLYSILYFLYGKFMLHLGIKANDLVWVAYAFSIYVWVNRRQYPFSVRCNPFVWPDPLGAIQIQLRIGPPTTQYANYK